ncbi:MAG: YihA family ribosome biogenesis GTP-binding protein [Burkholderiaceae bacterium]|nr:YihA family ribosome biogenesis GTP-binding protein [Burkholderiaceae bacterium]
MSLFESARFRLSASELKGLPDMQVPEIAFAGRSNAGKSTTINVLTRQGRLAFASKTPGRTQLINFFSLTQKNEEGGRDHIADLVDLPGYGFAKAAEATRKTWSDLIGGYLAIRENLTGIVVVMDARRPFMPTDEWLIQFLSTRPVRLHFLLNKADQLNNQGKKDVLRLAQARAKQMGPHVSVQLFSGLKREGVDELRDVLLHWINREEIIQQDI